MFEDGKYAEERVLLKNSDLYLLVSLNLVEFSDTSEHVRCIFVERVFRKGYVL